MASAFASGPGRLCLRSRAYLHEAIHDGWSEKSPIAQPRQKSSWCRYPVREMSHPIQWLLVSAGANSEAARGDGPPIAWAGPSRVGRRYWPIRWHARFGMALTFCHGGCRWRTPKMACGVTSSVGLPPILL